MNDVGLTADDQWCPQCGDPREACRCAAAKPQGVTHLTFNTDGTIDPAQLEGLPEDVKARLTSPDFIAQARRQIEAQRKRDDLQKQGRTVRALAQYQHDVRRPPELSGRQRKRLRKEVRRTMKMARATLQNESGGAHAESSHNQP